MNIRVVVPAQLLLLFLGPRPERHLYVGIGVLAAHHEADLARGVGWDGCVGVLSHRENFLAVFLELGNELEVEPLVLSWNDWLARTQSPLPRRGKDLRKMGSRWAGKRGKERRQGKEDAETGLGGRRDGCGRMG